MTLSRPRRTSLEPSVLHQSVVVFSRNYLPMTRINIKRAVTLLVTGRAEPMEFSTGKSWEIRSPSVVLRVPDQIRLTFASGERTWKVPPVNRREVLRRDHYSCQYCGSTRRLTIDHVIPLSKGGKHRWDNVITACERCNQQKGDRTPDQAGMPLRSKPKAPVHPSVTFAEQFWRNEKEGHETWNE